MVFPTLLTTRRFFPLFATQFLGAFNDNVFKNALILLITYRAEAWLGLKPHMLVTLAAGVFILPFLLFPPWAGQLADKYDKSLLIRRIKLVEIAIMLCAAIGFYLQNIWLLLAVLFCMGAQSAFFGPLKYSILPDHLEKNELMAGNGLVQASTYLAILLGTITGGLLLLTTEGTTQVALAVIFLALCGWYASRFIPQTTSAAPNLIFHHNLFTEMLLLFGWCRTQPTIITTQLSIAWFWFMGSVFLSQFSIYAKEITGGNEEVATVFLAAFSIGIALGALLCYVLTRGDLRLTYVPLSGIGLTLAIIALTLLSPTPAATPSLVGATEFFSSSHNIFITLTLTTIALCGGVYVVPLYAYLQYIADPAWRARVISFNNILNALFMVLSALIILLLYSLHLSVMHIFLFTAIGNLFFIFLTRRLVQKT